MTESWSEDSVGEDHVLTRCRDSKAMYVEHMHTCVAALQADGTYVERPKKIVKREAHGRLSLSFCLLFVF